MSDEKIALSVGDKLIHDFLSKHPELNSHAYFESYEDLSFKIDTAIKNSIKPFPTKKEINDFKSSINKLIDPSLEKLKHLTINATIEFFSNYYKS